MANVLSEVTADTIDPEHVRQRVANWKRRIEALYTLIEGWLPAVWQSVRSPALMPMLEDMMRSARVPQQQLDELRLFGPDGRITVLTPRALWIIGANGRLDLRSDGRPYVIVDTAENSSRQNGAFLRCMDAMRAFH